MRRSKGRKKERGKGREKEKRLKEKGGKGRSEGGFLYVAWDPFTGNRSENLKIFIVFQMNAKI